MRAIKGYSDKWRVQEYLLITFFISWLAWGLLVLLTATNAITLMSPLGIILFGIGGFGPTISGIICIEGKITFRKVLELIFHQNKRSWLVFLIFAVLAILTIGLSSQGISQNAPAWYLWIPILIFITLFGGGNEELGWRGTMQPVLSRVVSRRIKNTSLAFMVTTIIIGIVWALWHLPLWFVAGSSQQSINYGIFIVECIALSFILGSIYVRSGSVIYCMVFHGLMNVLMGALFTPVINWVSIAGFILMVVVAVILASVKLPAPKSTKDKQ